MILRHQRLLRSVGTCVFMPDTPPKNYNAQLIAKREDVGASLASNLSDFVSIGALPPTIKIAALDEGPGINATLLARNAKWHKSCRNAVNSLNFLRLQKKANETENDVELTDSGDELHWPDGMTGTPRLSRKKASDANCIFAITRLNKIMTYDT